MHMYDALHHVSLCRSVHIFLGRMLTGSSTVKVFRLPITSTPTSCITSPIHPCPIQNLVLSTCSLNGYIEFVLLRFALALTRSSRAQLHHLAFANIFSVSLFSLCLLSLSGEAEKETVSPSSFTRVPSPAPDHNKNPQSIFFP